MTRVIWVRFAAAAGMLTTVAACSSTKEEAPYVPSGPVIATSHATSASIRGDSLPAEPQLTASRVPDSPDCAQSPETVNSAGPSNIPGSDTPTCGPGQ